MTNLTLNFVYNLNMITCLFSCCVCVGGVFYEWLGVAFSYKI